MTTKMIEDEVAQFNDNFFNDYFELVDSNVDFIESHKLYQPKQNYFLTYEFVTTTIKHFKNLDFRFMSSTFEKLNRDIIIIQKQYVKLLENEEKMREIFKTYFLKKSPLFQEIYNALIELQKSVELTDYEKETKEILNEHYAEMQEIYYEYFMTDFLSLNKEFIHNLRSILNTKIYYLDRLLWIHAKESAVIDHFLKTLKLTKNISSKKYINYRLGVTLPYSDNYKYLQKCARIYK
jgi:hypothetical protein